MVAVRRNPLPNGGEISEVRDDVHLDIDRWENDGGRNINTRSNRMKDTFY